MMLSAFDEIIGYQSIVEELKQLCDMMQHPEAYVKLGAQIPKGLLLCGVPGCGKTMMANALIKECGRKSYIIRRGKPTDSFISEMNKTFQNAIDNSPSIILLDDMDKFAVKERSKEEYIAVQACIDEVHNDDVFVIGTANSINDFPESLLRSGRFDRAIVVPSPNDEDLIKIISYYLSKRRFVDHINTGDIAKMLYGVSCADVESIINEAAIYSGADRADVITQEKIIKAFIRSNSGIDRTVSLDCSKNYQETLYHEAGHAVISDILVPGSVGFIALNSNNGKYCNGITINCCLNSLSNDERIEVYLAGKAAEELKFGKTSVGSSTDLNRAFNRMSRRITDNGEFGIGMLSNKNDDDDPSCIAIIRTSLERYFAFVKEILAANRTYLEYVVKELTRRNYLLNSDIIQIRKRIKIVSPKLHVL